MCKEHVVKESHQRLRIQCFGNFEVFVDEKPVTFPRKKSKELFAYLIDRRGSQVSMAEISSILWEDGEYNISRNNQIHSFLHDLVKTLDDLGEKDIIFKSRNAIAVDTSKFTCDAYDFINGDIMAINSYNGEYMYQYSWAEFSNGLFNKLD